MQGNSLKFGQLKYDEKEKRYSLFLKFPLGSFSISDSNYISDLHLSKGAKWLIYANTDIKSLLRDIHVCFPDFSIKSLFSICYPGVEKKVERQWNIESSAKVKKQGKPNNKTSIPSFLKFGRFGLKERQTLYELFKTNNLPNILADPKLLGGKPKDDILHFLEDLYSVGKKSIPFIRDKNVLSVKNKLVALKLVDNLGHLLCKGTTIEKVSYLMSKCLFTDYIYTLLAVINAPDSFKLDFYRLWCLLSAEKQRKCSAPEKLLYNIPYSLANYIPSHSGCVEQLCSLYGNSFLFTKAQIYIDIVISQLKENWYNHYHDVIKQRIEDDTLKFSDKFMIIDFGFETKLALSYLYKKYGRNYYVSLKYYVLADILPSVESYWDQLNFESDQQSLTDILSKKESGDINCVEVPWEAVTFKDNTIGIFKFRNLKKVETNDLYYQILSDMPIFYYTHYGIREQYNWIKKAFSLNMPKLKVYVDREKKILRMASEKIDLDKILEVLKSKSAESIDFTNDKVAFLSSNSSFETAKNMPEKKIKSLLEKFKSKYIDYLIENNLEGMKIIPCMERRTNTQNEVEEPAFIFTIKARRYFYDNSGNVKIVFENVYDNNASIVFITTRDKYSLTLQSIYNFFRSDTVNKRQKIHEGRIDHKLLNVTQYYAVNHISKSDWVSNL